MRDRMLAVGLVAGILLIGMGIIFGSGLLWIFGVCVTCAVPVAAIVVAVDPKMIEEKEDDE
jgi:hypothetical protein